MQYLASFVWLWICCSSALAVPYLPLDTSAASSGVRLFMSISSVAGTSDGSIYERQLEVAWTDLVDAVQSGDTIGIFSLSEAPYCAIGSEVSAPVESIELTPAMQQSWVRASTQMPYLSNQEIGYDSNRCLVYWAGYIRNNELLGCACLQPQPNWMIERQNSLGDFKLRELFLPGSHDAAAYDKYRGIISENPATRYSIAQNENLGAQLQFGIRYLDIRISYYESTDEQFWTHHGTYPLRPLVEDIALVKDFLQNTQEIVIFDIHDVVGFGDNQTAHDALQSLLYEQFNTWMAPDNLTWDVTLNQLWAANKRLIVTYNDAHGDANPWLWEAVHHKWGNVDQVELLESYLDGVMKQAANGEFTYPFSCMAELTPTGLDIAEDRLGGLRAAADSVNRNVSIWFATRWYESATIVSNDFMLGSQIINIALSENDRRSSVKLTDALLYTGAKFSKFTLLTDCLNGKLNESTKAVQVFLTLSPLAQTLPDETIIQRQIELNWESIHVHNGDWVGLFDHDPSNNPTEPLVRIPANEHPGYYRTEIQFPDLNLTALQKFEDSCVGYWIGYIRQGSTAATNCLKIRPSWMWTNRDFLGHFELKDLMIPGTHNAGSYNKYLGGVSDNVISRYLTCHDEDIWHQLIYGIRYFDIRIGYYPDLSDKFWMNHNYARMNPLPEFITSVKRYLQETREILILDLHRFPVGFNNGLQGHHELVQYLYSELGEFMAPRDMINNATMNHLWEANKTLIVSYANYDMRAAYDKLWPDVPQEWGDKQSVQDLQQYLDEVIHRRRGYPYIYAAMAELTPSAFDIFLRPNDGLRKLADRSNRNVTAWFRNLWWSKANVVAVDFFHSTDIVDVALMSNLQRSYCKSLSHPIPIVVDEIQERVTVDRQPSYQGPRLLQGPATTRNPRRRRKQRTGRS